MRTPVPWGAVLSLSSCSVPLLFSCDGVSGTLLWKLGSLLQKLYLLHLRVGLYIES